MTPRKPRPEPVALREIARRSGLAPADIIEAARREALEATYSPAEVGAYLGIGPTMVAKLIGLGVRHGEALHPRCGGLWPTFKVSHKCRRIPRSAIERHLAHMARAHGGAAA